MNDLIKDNRHKIDTACHLCFLALDRQKEAVKHFHEERRKIEHSMYIQEERERMVDKVAKALGSSSAKEYEVIHEALESMRVAAGEMEQLLDIGSDFQNTLAVIKTLGKAIPMEQRASMIEPFKGQMQALKLLRTACEATDISTEHLFRGLIFDTSAQVDSLDELARRITIQPHESTLSTVALASALEKFATAMGVELTHSFRDLADLSGALTDAIRTAAGVGIAD